MTIRVKMSLNTDKFEYRQKEIPDTSKNNDVSGIFVGAGGRT